MEEIVRFELERYAVCKRLKSTDEACNSGQNTQAAGGLHIDRKEVLYARSSPTMASREPLSIEGKPAGADSAAARTRTSEAEARKRPKRILQDLKEEEMMPT